MVIHYGLLQTQGVTAETYKIKKGDTFGGREEANKLKQGYIRKFKSKY